MQYILSELEYSMLKAGISPDLKIDPDKLQAVCSDFANLASKSKDQYEWAAACENGNPKGCCGFCPAKRICPSKNKRISKYPPTVSKT